MAPVHEATELLRGMTCPACGHHVAVPLFRSEAEPALDVVRCVDCGHAFNAAAASHADPQHRTFSGGPGWPEHVRAVRDEMLGRLPAAPVVVEVGHGDAQFLTALAEARPAGRYVGFDPHGATDAGHPAIDLRREHFVAARALAELSPHVIVNRYVMEYLAHPLGFIQEFAFAAAASGIQPVLYLEVPCIDRALEKGRTFHFDHRHTSYFTTASFMRMLSRCGPVEQRIGHGYHGEVVYRFPLVVDSDAATVGTMVAGTGQEIRSPDWLRAHPVDVVIIPMHRRAHDIVREMAAADIRCDTILIEDRGRLIDYSIQARDGMLRDACERVPALASR